MEQMNKGDQLQPEAASQSPEINVSEPSSSMGLVGYLALSKSCSIMFKIKLINLSFFINIKQLTIN